MRLVLRVEVFRVEGLGCSVEKLRVYTGRGPFVITWVTSNLYTKGYL